MKVLKVNTLNRKGKKRVRQSQAFGKRPDTKRAIVTLDAGERIDLFEGDRSDAPSKRKPTSPAAGSRPSPTSPRSHRRAERTLIGPKPRSGGRNTYGRKTARHRGGGHKRQYRIIDFKRVKDGVPAKVATIEYDPNRNCRILLLHYHDGEKRYILAPRREGRRPAAERARAPRSAGNALPLRYIPVGTTVHNVELAAGQGGKMARSAGSSVQLVAKEGDFATLRLPSTEMRRADRLPGHRRRGRQRRGRAGQGRQGRPQPLEGRPPADPWRGHEPRRPPARRW